MAQAWLCAYPYVCVSVCSVHPIGHEVLRVVADVDSMEVETRPFGPWACWVDWIQNGTDCGSPNSNTVD